MIVSALSYNHVEINVPLLIPAVIKPYAYGGPVSYKTN